MSPTLVGGVQLAGLLQSALAGQVTFRTCSMPLPGTFPLANDT